MATPTFFHRHQPDHQLSLSITHFKRKQRTLPFHFNSWQQTRIRKRRLQEQKKDSPCKSSKPPCFSFFSSSFPPFPHRGSVQWVPSPPHSATTASSVPLMPAGNRKLYVGAKIAALLLLLLLLLLHLHYHPWTLFLKFLQWQLSQVAKVSFVAS